MLKPDVGLTGDTSTITVWYAWYDGRSFKDCLCGPYETEELLKQYFKEFTFKPTNVVIESHTIRTEESRLVKAVDLDEYLKVNS